MIVLVLLVVLLAADKEDGHLVDRVEDKMDLHLVLILAEHKDK